MAGAAWRYQITGATTLAMSADVTREEFVYSPEKDSTSVRVAPGVEFDSRAIISGRAYVGYRRFTITSGLAPTFAGPVASVELSSTVREATRLGVQVGRDVAYSFDITTPYYLLGGIGGSVGHRVGQHWDFSASASRQNLHYQAGSAGGAGRTNARETHGPCSHLRRNVDLSAQQQHAPGRHRRSVAAAVGVDWAGI